MSAIVDPEKRGFIQGYAVAVGVIVRLHDHPSIAADLLQQSGFTLRDFERAGVDEYDLKPVRKLFREMRRPRPATSNTPET